MKEYTPSDTLPPVQLLLPMKKSYDKKFVIDVESTNMELFPYKPPSASEDMDTWQIKPWVMSCEASLYHKEEAEQGRSISVTVNTMPTLTLEN